MFSRLVNLIPRDWLVFMYKHLPFIRFKNWIVYRAQYKFLVAVLGVFTNDQGQILLLKHVYRKEPWGIPGGWMELEQPEEALRRELKEETGITVQSLRLAKAIYGAKPNRIELIYRGNVNEETFIPSSEISEITYSTVGRWPEGLPLRQRELIQEIIKEA